MGEVHCTRPFEYIYVLRGNACYLLLEVLEEAIDRAFDGTLEDDIGNGGDLAFHRRVRVVGKVGSLGDLVEGNGASCFDGTERAAWLRDQNNVGRLYNVFRAQVDSVGSSQSGNVR
jgi:hypothetical protein